MDESFKHVVVNEVSVNFGTLIPRNLDLETSLGTSVRVRSPSCLTREIVIVVVHHRYPIRC
jgi:hypothetical protein